ncbi:DUF4178 domain-containing protein [bacterium]|nr:MAG: DUF4178 domain-containing protein [bacterium]
MAKEALEHVRSLSVVQREPDLSRLAKGCVVASEDELFSVEGVTRYEERYGGRLYVTPELLLRSLLDGRRLSLAIESGDELRIDLQVDRLRLSELGLDNGDLARMDDEEEGAFTFQGRRFEYADSGDAKLVSEEGEQPLYYWDFDATDGSHRISVERYDAAPEVYLMRRVSPQKLEAFSVPR